MEKKMETTIYYLGFIWGLGFWVYFKGHGDLVSRLIVGIIGCGIRLASGNVDGWPGRLGKHSYDPYTNLRCAPVIPITHPNHPTIQVLRFEGSRGSSMPGVGEVQIQVPKHPSGP